jgi:hypothetical protein
MAGNHIFTEEVEDEEENFFFSSVFFSADSVLILRSLYTEFSLQKASKVCQIHASIGFPVDDLGFFFFELI